MLTDIDRIKVVSDPGLVLARKRTRQIAALLRMAGAETTGLTTAVSEIVRNALVYAHGCEVHFAVVTEDSDNLFRVEIMDGGAGISNVSEILVSQSSGLEGSTGIHRARRLVDHFEIESTPAGTRVTLGVSLPASPTREELDELVREIARQEPANPYQEIEKLSEELRASQEENFRLKEELRLEVARLNEELMDTNRGVIALYAELDEKAQSLKRADELKSRFLSNVSHEFRTPLNSIIALAGLLPETGDAPLSAEQQKQVSFIKKAAQELIDQVNDLLDLAKIEAGKVDIRPNTFSASELFGTLRGMFRPLMNNPAVELIFEAPRDVPAIFSDEAKVSQILRNYISNAIKFTEKGEVRVSAALDPAGHNVLFSVSDTGIGMSADGRKLIFQEFVQLPSPLQKKTKGTGLGLALCRKLADLLNGTVSFTSEPGKGSTFCISIPVSLPGTTIDFVTSAETAFLDPLRFPVLAVQDDRQALDRCREAFKETEFQLVAVQTLRDAASLIPAFRPIVVFLDLSLTDMDPWNLVASLKQNPATWNTPLFLMTETQEQWNEGVLGGDTYCLKGADPAWLLERTRRAAATVVRQKILIVDDEDVERYLIVKNLSATRFELIQASNGLEGLKLAEERQPVVILLDLNMPEVNGFDVLARLKANGATERIPVIVNTSRILEEGEREYIAQHAAALISKQTSSRQETLATIRRVLAGATESPSQNQGQ